jgi:ubiquinone/menaquinone biosynthesis C-methylase UbiE
MRHKQYFNEAARTWDEKFYTPALATFLENLIPSLSLQAGQNILDVGTGTGILIPFLLQAIGSEGSITAIDYAEQMVQICRSKYSQLKNVTIKLQDVEELDLPSESFDAVICFGLFPHLEDKEQALYHIHRVLKPSGKLIIAHALSSAEIKAHHNSTSSAVVHDVLPEESEMKRLLKCTGFIKISVKDNPGCYLCLSTRP